MTAAALIAQSTGLDIWGDLGYVILAGIAAGTGLSVIIALTIRSFVHQADARREGRRRAAGGWAVTAFVFLALSTAVVLLGLYTMLHG